jgi:succinoglycan biosynthesis transport protein ExoP
MELLHYLAIVRKWFWLILLATALAAGSSFIASQVAVPVYRTTTTVMVSRVIESRNPDQSAIFASQQLAQTYVVLITKEPILRATVEALGLQRDWRSLRGQVTAAPIQGTQLLAISVIDTSPPRAKAIADQIAQQLILQSPTTPSADEQARIEFIRAQLTELETRITEARAKIDELDQQIAGARSAAQIALAQEQQAVLRSQVTQWQTTYAQLNNSAQQSNVNYLSIVEPADLPTRPVSPRTGLNVALAIAIGLTLSIGAVLLLEYLDDSIRSPAEVRTLLNAPILAGIGRITGDGYSAQLIAEREPRSPLTEAYRALRTNLQFSSLDTPLKTVVVTSAGPSEGKSLTSSNLAVVLAQAGMAVVLVDADLRRPVVHKVFGLKNNVGLTSWLVAHPQTEPELAVSGRRAEPPGLSQTGPLEPYLQTTTVPRLRVVTSGPLPPNPAEVLGSTRMRQFLEEVVQVADIVVLDSPPCVTVTDAVVLSRWADGVIVVLDQKNTNRQGLQRARENLQAVGARILGAVINRLDAGSGGGYYYASYSSSYYYRDDAAVSGNGKAPSGLRKWLARTRPSKPKSTPGKK